MRRPDGGSAARSRVMSRITLETSTVCIVGLGLIGGSLGMALGAKKAVRRIVGVDVNERTLQIAVEKGAIHTGSLDLTSACRDADLLVIATPVRLIPKIIQAALPHLRAGAVLTDVGSTKAYVCAAAASLFDDGARVAFVGGHPMAGSEHAGVEAARPDLFQGCSYVLCPPVVPEVRRARNKDGADSRDSASPARGAGAAEQEAMSLVRGMVEAVGAKPVVMEPGEHDRIVAATSQLPYVAAVAVAAACAGLSGDLPRLTELVAGGFRDGTRVASGDPVMGRDMLLTNRAELRVALDVFRKELDKLEQLLFAADGVDDAAAPARVEDLTRHLREVKDFRDEVYRHDGK